MSGAGETPAATARRPAGIQYETRFGMSAEDYRTWAEERTAQGWVPQLVTGCAPGGQESLCAIWRRPPVSTSAYFESRVSMTAEEYDEWATELGSQGYGPVCLNGYVLNDEPRYCAVLMKPKQGALANSVVLRGEPLVNYLSLGKQLVEQEYTPFYASGFAEGMIPYYNVAWTAAKPDIPVPYEMQVGLTREKWDEFATRMVEGGYHLTVLNAHAVDGTPHYNGIWRRPEGGAMVDFEYELDLTLEQYQTWAKDLQGKRYRPLSFDNYIDADGTMKFCGIYQRPKP